MRKGKITRSYKWTFKAAGASTGGAAGSGRGEARPDVGGRPSSIPVSVDTLTQVTDGQKTRQEGP